LGGRNLHDLFMSLLCRFLVGGFIAEEFKWNKHLYKSKGFCNRSQWAPCPYNKDYSCLSAF